MLCFRGRHGHQWFCFELEARGGLGDGRILIQDRGSLTCDTARWNDQNEKTCSHAGHYAMRIPITPRFERCE